MRSRIISLLVLLAVGFSALITVGERQGWDFLPTWDSLFVTAGLREAPVYDYDGLSVHFLDVGQGDSILIISEGQAVLIDAGDTQYGQRVAAYIEAQGVEKLDAVIATHPHADHIGGLPEVLDAFPVETVIMPEVHTVMVPTTNVYRNFLSAVQTNGADAQYAKAGTQMQVGEGVLTILSPLGDGVRSNLNNYSVAARLEYGGISFLFTGDCESAAEGELVRSGYDLSATVLKCGHHGSSTSSTEEFLDAVQADYAVISCGMGNKYGHPDSVTLEKLDSRGIKTYRTDRQGTVLCTTDGNAVSITTET